MPELGVQSLEKWKMPSSGRRRNAAVRSRRFRTERGTVVRTNWWPDSVKDQAMVLDAVEALGRSHVRIVDTGGQDPEDFYNRTFSPSVIRKDRVYIWICGKAPGGSEPNMEHIVKKARFGTDEVEVRETGADMSPNGASPWMVVKDQRGRSVARVTDGALFLPFMAADFMVVEDKDVKSSDTVSKSMTINGRAGANIRVALAMVAAAGRAWSVYRREFAGQVTPRSYSDFCGDAVAKRRADLERRRSDAEVRLRRAESEVTRVSREWNDLRRELENMDPEEISDELRSQHRHLMRLVDDGLYEGFKIRLGWLLGKTMPIVIEHNGKRYELGQYVVKIDKAGGVEIEHALRRNPPHPHIANGGTRPCWGSAAADIPKLVGMERYGVVFQLIAEFLTTYNGGSPHTKIEMFEMVDGVTLAEVAIREARDLSQTNAGAVPQRGEEHDLIARAPNVVPVRSEDDRDVAPHGYAAALQDQAYRASDMARALFGNSRQDAVIRTGETG